MGCVMRELRTHLATPEEFIERVQREQKEGYRLAFLEANGAVRATAGCRIIDLLFSGRTLCVNDLVTHEGTRSLGFGGRSSIGSSRKRDARSVSTREA